MISDLAVAEFGSAISRLVRMEKISAAKAARIFDSFDRLTLAQSEIVEAIAVDVRYAAQLVRRPQSKLLTADAIHIATSRRFNAKLVSFDQDQIIAAQGIGVTCLTPT